MNTVSSKAKIGSDVTIGINTIVEDDVEIGNNVSIGANVLIANGARISDNVKIHHGAVISTLPQDLKFSGEATIFEVGEGTVIREYATLNRGTKHSGKSSVGKNCFLMAYVHVAHDCFIGDNVIIANAANMGGHVEIDDYAIIGGMVPIHQFTKIGKHSIIGAAFRTVKDVPPYIVAGDYPLKFGGVNIVGLRRRGFSSEKINTIKDVYRTIYQSGYNVSDAVKHITDSFEMTEEVTEILNFISRSERGIIRG